MLTIYAVPAPEPVLVGTLRTHRRGRIKGRPMLSVETWCPWCREVHAAGWPDTPFALDCVVPFDPPCRSGAFAGRTIMVGLDPDRHAEHSRLGRQFAASLRGWRSQERLRLQFAEARAADRRHLAEGWDVLPGA